MKTLSEHRCFGGTQGFYEHDSATIGLPMRFGVYRPPQALADGAGAMPSLVYLAGLTCNEETFAIKAGAQRVAAEFGVVLVTPDTSPRDSGIEGADSDWDFGTAASFYLDATAQPWSRRFRMESWLTQELPQVLREGFKLDPARTSLCGHSMGGHGALTLALRHPGRYPQRLGVGRRSRRPRSARGASRPSAATWERIAAPGPRTMRPNSSASVHRCRRC